MFSWAVSRRMATSLARLAFSLPVSLSRLISLTAITCPLRT